MASLNQCNFIGNLGSDLELRYTKEGIAVGNVSIAVNEKYKEKETTTWVKLVFFGKKAEIIEKYTVKGSSLFVSGRLQTSKYEKEGQTHYSTDIVVSTFQFLGGKRDGTGDQHGGQQNADQQNADQQNADQNSQRQPQGQNQQSGAPLIPDYDPDEIPF